MNTNQRGRVRRLEAAAAGLQLGRWPIGVDFATLSDDELEAISRLPPPPGMGDLKKLSDVELADLLSRLTAERAQVSAPQPGRRRRRCSEN